MTAPDTLLNVGLSHQYQRNPGLSTAMLVVSLLASAVPVLAIAPLPTGVTPVNGIATSTTFSATFNTQGGSSIQYASILINSVLNGPYSCWVQVDVSQNKLYLVNNNATGTFAPITPGTSSSVSNGQCTLYATGSGISVSGQVLTVAFQIEFLPSFPTPSGATKYIWLSADNQTNESSGWVGGPSNNWHWNTGFGHQAPYIDSAIPLEPASGKAPAQMFTAVFSDYEGAQDLAVVDMLINSSLTGSNACWVRWVRNGDQLYLINDGATNVISPGFFPASTESENGQTTLSQVNATVSNSQCRLLREGSQMKRLSTNALSVRFHIQFHSAFVGTKSVWLSASDNSSLFSGWVWKGTFVVTTAPDPVGISPVSLEINLGPLPVDVYNTQNCRFGNCFSDPQDRYIQSCSSTVTVRQCLQSILKTNTDSYYNQGVRGVRFMFGLGGGWYSTPFDASGNIQTVWTGKLQTFFDDLKSWGFTHVTPTPVTTGPWSDSSGGPTVVISSGLTRPNGCTPETQSQTFYFHKWLPFGYTKSGSTYTIEGLDTNAAYNCAYANPQFWGWNSMFTLIDSIAYAAYRIELTSGSRLMIRDFDLENETSLWTFPVMGRLVYDNMTTGGLDVAIGVANALTGSGSRPLYSAAASTISTSIDRPNTRSPGYHCSSVYGDSAQLTNLMNMFAAQAGGAFGVPAVREARFGMYCSDPNLSQVQSACGSPFATDGDFNPQWSTCMTGSMITLPRQAPTTAHVLNTHTHVCVTHPVHGDCQLRYYNATDANGQPVLNQPPPDITSTAMSLYGSVWSLMRSRQLTSRPIVFGETSTNTGTTAAPCGEHGSPPTGGSSDAQAQQNAKGLKQSTLRSPEAAALTRVLRPWASTFTTDGPCAYVPTHVGGSGDPFQQ